MTSFPMPLLLKYLSKLILFFICVFYLLLINMCALGCFNVNSNFSLWNCFIALRRSVPTLHHALAIRRLLIFMPTPITSVLPFHCYYIATIITTSATSVLLSNPFLILYFYFFPIPNEGSSYLHLILNCVIILYFSLLQTYTLVSTVTSSLPLLNSGFQRRTFPFLSSPTSATSFSQHSSQRLDLSRFLTELTDCNKSEL
jgi:hypothetical protein